jgi:tetratricopeptide (TPR) repeat protein
MADSFRTEGSRAIDDAPDADRDAKIEQLLLAGLDHYFAARYERAINVWTRALFFDRSHARARAYIDRARSALAERQRRLEELLQGGAAALDRGQGSEARRLLQAAVESGARVDELQPLADRLNRQPGNGRASIVDGPSRPVVVSRESGRTAVPVAPLDDRGRGGQRFAAVVTLALLAAVAVGTYAIVLGKEPRSWFGGQDAPPPSAIAPTLRDTALPLPRRGEMALSRAKALALRGRLHEALSTLDLIRATDPEKVDADRVRGDVQRQLLELVSIPPSPGRGSGQGRNSRP